MTPHTRKNHSVNHPSSTNRNVYYERAKSPNYKTMVSPYRSPSHQDINQSKEGSSYQYMYARKGKSPYKSPKSNENALSAISPNILNKSQKQQTSSLKS